MLRDQSDYERSSAAAGPSALIHSIAWQSTPLGPMAGWPESLRIIVDLVLSHDLPMNILWGLEHVQIYNDAYSSILAQARNGLGGCGRPSTPEVWKT
jgi:hypothetical protein